MKQRFAEIAELSAVETAALRDDTPIRRLVIELLGAARRRGWPFLSDLLSGAFRARRHAAPDQRLVARALHALVRAQRLLAFTVGDACDTQLDAVLAIAGVDLPRRRYPEAVADLDGRIEAIAEPIERLGVSHSLPDWLVRVVLDDLGAEAGARACARLDRPAPRTLRVNTLRSTREACLAALAREGASVQPTTHAPAGIRVLGAFDLFASEPFRTGSFELQDEASQLVADVVAPPRGLVVDACAGSGGKTLALGALMGGRGRLIALEPAAAKLAELKRRAQRAELHNAILVRADMTAARQDDPKADASVRRLEGASDRVLVDAPCSGLGALRRNPEARWRLEPADLGRLADLQRRILERAAGLVAPGGRVVYATCSFLRREGREVVEAFGAAHPDFVPMPVREILGAARATPIADPSGMYMDTWGAPTADDGSEMDGFFAAALRRPRA